SSGGNGFSEKLLYNRDGGDAGEIEISGEKITLGGDLFSQGGQGRNGYADGDGKNITLNGNIELAADITLGADVETEANIQKRGNIIIDGSVGSEDANPYSLTLTAKDITFKENFNQTNRVGALTINATGNVKAQSDSLYKNIYATSLKVTANSFSVGNINTASDLGIGGVVTISAKNNIYVK